MTTPVRLGLRENAQQFTLLVALNALVGAMVGLERSVLPLVGEEEFGLTSKGAILSFILAFGASKALANLVSGSLAEQQGRKRVLVLGWLLVLPVPLLIAVAPSWAFIVIANLFCLYLAVGGLGWLISSLSERRGKAIAIVFSILLASFLLSFLAQFWEPARRISWIGLLNYYQPLAILQSESWPWRNMAVLTVFGGVCWLVGGVIFARRDIRTV